MKLFLFFLLFLGMVPGSWAQSMDTDLTPAEGVRFMADSRIGVLVSRQKQMQMSANRSQRGYRVQIYSGNDRQRANEIKIDFMKRFPGVRTYLSYVQPQFRVKVGDYAERSLAREMYLKVSPLYNPCMIVPDIILRHPGP